MLESVESPPGQERERDLLARSRAGDPAALDLLLQENLPALWRFSLGITADRGLAEDLAQETLARFIGGLPSFEGRCRVSTYLYSIAHSVYITQKRRDARKEQVHRRWAERERPADPDSAVDDVLRVLAGLEDDLRLPCVLYYVEQRSIDEIGEALSLTRTTVKWRLHQARAELRQRMKENRP
jgi:RNA polymerase sigma-70 factor (ECF subfamily)